MTLTLRKPRIGWFPKPTVVIGDRGHPAQWGSGTWQLTPGEPTTIGVYLFNRLWRFGAASVTVEPDAIGPLIYRAPWLPFLPGRLQAETE